MIFILKTKNLSMNTSKHNYTDMFINNVKNTKDYTYKNLKGIINDVLRGDKDSRVLLMQ